VSGPWTCFEREGSPPYLLPRLISTTANYDPAGTTAEPMCAGAGTKYTVEKRDGGLRWTAYGYTADLERRTYQPTGSAD